MSEPKSALVLQQSPSKQQKPAQSGLHYQPQLNQEQDHPGQLSDEEKEAEFNRQHEEYIQMKLNRKKELLRRKRE